MDKQNNRETKTMKPFNWIKKNLISVKASKKNGEGEEGAEVKGEEEEGAEAVESEEGGINEWGGKKKKKRNKTPEKNPILLQQHGH